MSNPALAASLADLDSAVKRLHEETDTLNVLIQEIEGSLVAMNPGIALWLPKPILVYGVNGPSGFGTQLGFVKPKDQWCLSLRRGAFLKSDKDWTPVTKQEWKVFPVLEGTRDERVAAVSEFRALVEAMTAEAEVRVKALQAAKQRAR